MARKFKSNTTKYKYYAKMINKSLKKIAKETPSSKALQYIGQFPLSIKGYSSDEISELSKKAEAVYTSGQVSIVNSRRTEALAINTLRQKHGMTYIDRRNFSSLMKFLDDARARGLGSLYSSTQLIEAIHQAKQAKLTKSQILANIEYWSNKNIKYDKEGKIVEPSKYRPLSILKKDSDTMKEYQKKVRERIKREK